jgi:hypothetical protein
MRERATDLLYDQRLASSCGILDNAPLKCSDESHEPPGSGKPPESAVFETEPETEWLFVLVVKKS